MAVYNLMVGDKCIIPTTQRYVVTVAEVTFASEHGWYSLHNGLYPTAARAEFCYKLPDLKLPVGTKLHFSISDIVKSKSGKRSITKHTIPKAIIEYPDGRKEFSNIDSIWFAIPTYVYDEM